MTTIKNDKTPIQKASLLRPKIYHKLLGTRRAGYLASFSPNDPEWLVENPEYLDLWVKIKDGGGSREEHQKFFDFIEEKRFEREQQATVYPVRQEKTNVTPLDAYIDVLPLIKRARVMVRMELHFATNLIANQVAKQVKRGEYTNGTLDKEPFEAALSDVRQRISHRLDSVYELLDDIHYILSEPESEDTHHWIAFPLHFYQHTKELDPLYKRILNRIYQYMEISYRSRNLIFYDISNGHHYTMTHALSPISKSYDHHYLVLINPNIFANRRDALNMSDDSFIEYTEAIEASYASYDKIVERHIENGTLPKGYVTKVLSILPEKSHSNESDDPEDCEACLVEDNCDSCDDCNCCSGDSDAECDEECDACCDEDSCDCKDDDYCDVSCMVDACDAIDSTQQERLRNFIPEETLDATVKNPETHLARKYIYGLVVEEPSQYEGCTCYYKEPILEENTWTPEIEMVVVDRLLQNIERTIRSMWSHGRHVNTYNRLDAERYIKQIKDDLIAKGFVSDNDANMGYQPTFEELLNHNPETKEIYGHLMGEINAYTFRDLIELEKERRSGTYQQE